MICLLLRPVYIVVCVCYCLRPSSREIAARLRKADRGEMSENDGQAAGSGQRERFIEKSRRVGGSAFGFAFCVFHQAREQFYKIWWWMMTRSPTPKIRSVQPFRISDNWPVSLFLLPQDFQHEAIHPLISSQARIWPGYSSCVRHDRLYHELLEFRRAGRPVHSPFQFYPSQQAVHQASRLGCRDILLSFP